MTVLSAMQSAAIRLIGRKPTVFFGAPESDKFELELVDLVNEVAAEIAESHDWQVLTKVYTITGDGVLSEFPLPSDYDRMLLDSELFDPNSWAWGYNHYTNVSAWLRDKARGLVGIPGAWIMLGNKFNFFPVPANAAEAEFPYISNQYARDAGNVARTAFMADDDSFILSEKLLTLALIWRYKSQKGLAYAEDMQNYEIELSKLQARDGGSRVIRKGSPRISGDVRLAWPWSLG